MSQLNRRQFAAWTAGAVALGGIPAARAQKAQDLPPTATILVPFPAGGGVDKVARLLAEHLRGQIAKTVVVENKTGAGGRLAIQALKKEAPDGLTVLLHAFGIQSLYPHVFKRLDYDPWKDLSPVTTLYPSEVCLAVGPGTPATVKTVADYLAWVKADAKNGSYGTGGAGTPNHLLVAALGRAAGIELVPVHYRGGNAAFPDLVGGQIPAMGAQLDFAARNLETGKIRILASFGAKRSPLLPSVPTVAELGYPGLVSSGSFCAYVHGATPAPVQERLSATLRKILAEPAVKAVFKQDFVEAVGSTPQEALRQAKADFELSSRLVKAIGYTPE